MRSNPFKGIYEICNSGNSKKKLENLPDFPRYLDIELTNTCNFSCLMCSTGLSIQQRKQGFMTDEIFHKIIDEIEEHKTPIRFIRWGEPTLHPRMMDYIRYAKERGILCHINTNGSSVDKKMIEGFVDIPLDSIKFSFQGVDRKSYREMRNIDFFDELMDVVRRLHEKRGGKEAPYIHISTTITYESQEMVDKFKEKVKGFVDLVTVGRTMLERFDPDLIGLGDEEKETLRYLKEKESVVKTHRECPEVFDKLSINWDGTVSACCADSDNKMTVGNLVENSLKDIWASKKMNFYREMLADMRHDELELCKGCYEIYEK